MPPLKDGLTGTIILLVKVSGINLKVRSFVLSIINVD